MSYLKFHARPKTQITNYEVHQLFSIRIMNATNNVNQSKVNVYLYSTSSLTGPSVE